MRTVMENTLGTSSSQLKSLWESPEEGKVFRERWHFLLALLETRRRVFWLDSPLKASFTSCRSASSYVSYYCGPQKMGPKCEEQKSRVVSCRYSMNSRADSTELLPRCPCAWGLCRLLGMSWLTFKMWTFGNSCEGHGVHKDCSPHPCDEE